MEKWKNNKFIENLKIKQYPAYPTEFMVFLCVTLFRQKMAEKRYTICILLAVELKIIWYDRMFELNRAVGILGFFVMSGNNFLKW